MRKRTLEKVKEITGVGVHSGQNINLTLRPSDAGSIIFIRTDLENAAIKIDPRRIEAKYSSVLKDKGREIQTFEHLMAALYMLGIDSLSVELDGNEIPILDGSAEPFIRLIQDGGSRELSEDKKKLMIIKPFQIQEGSAFIVVEPDDDCRINYIIEYDHPVLKRQDIDLTIDRDVFIKEIAPARTFGFLKDVPSMRSQGLALGGSLENAIILDEHGIINGPLRFPDEFVRHKVLDFLGDLSLLGYSITGHFKAYKSGHFLHHKLVVFLLDHPEYCSLNYA
ncbi:UDP-3-O-acyl-N-acetylglucosamine deacetylase [Acidobacteriota bacterium]